MQLTIHNFLNCFHTRFVSKFQIPDQIGTLIVLMHIVPFQKIFWPFTVLINYSSFLKMFAKGGEPSASHSQKLFLVARTFFPRSRSEQFSKQNTIHILNWPWETNFKGPKFSSFWSKKGLLSTYCLQTWHSKDV